MLTQVRNEGRIIKLLVKEQGDNLGVVLLHLGDKFSNAFVVCFHALKIQGEFAKCQGFYLIAYIIYT
ncbi:hypothetical protein DSECCO2_516120 [anaerobic digester metagenome]